jgi:lipoyl synthase
MSKTIAFFPPRRQLPDWLKTSLPRGANYFRLKTLVEKYKLNTVCESASCPNIGDCWSAGTLTLMILGDTCTRSCRFCDVPTGAMKPAREEEPIEIAEMLSKINLKYIVITSVDRDDMPDGGSNIWANTIRQIKKRNPFMKIEALIPDFKGKNLLIDKICQENPEVVAHNIETVESLQSIVRPQCRYSWSLSVLENASKNKMITKSSLMLGLGEKKNEVIKTIRHLAEINCQILSIGQYLRPSKKHLKVVEYILPETFVEYKNIGLSFGIKHVEAGPLVRSSFRADQQAENLLNSLPK